MTSLEKIDQLKKKLSIDKNRFLEIFFDIDIFNYNFDVNLSKLIFKFCERKCYLSILDVPLFINNPKLLENIEKLLHKKHYYHRNDKFIANFRISSLLCQYFIKYMMKSKLKLCIKCSNIDKYILMKNYHSPNIKNNEIIATLSLKKYPTEREILLVLQLIKVCPLSDFRSRNIITKNIKILSRQWFINNKLKRFIYIYEYYKN